MHDRQIWGEYFTGKTAVMAAVLTSDCYDELRGRSDQHATFVLPLPRDDGYEFIVCQFAANEVILHSAGSSSRSLFLFFIVAQNA